MKRLIVLAPVIFFMAPVVTKAQTVDEPQKKEYNRGQGFVVRPELCNGIQAALGYQLNPYLQLTGNIGVGIGKEIALITVTGIRAYFLDKPWTPFFDYHVGIECYTNMITFRQTAHLGASYKDFDFGAGMYLGTDGDIFVGASSLTLGDNIRCYKHR